MADNLPVSPPAKDCTVDLLVVGSGTGMATALAAHERGLDVLVAEKTAYVGGSTARSGGAYWIPANPAMMRDGAIDTPERGREYISSVVGDTSPEARWQAFMDYGDATVNMLERTTPLTFFWAKGYSDYHPEEPGGDATGRSCEAKPFDLRQLGSERPRFRPATMSAPVPMPVTGADYKWMNLMVKTPLKSIPKIVKSVIQGMDGLVIKKEFSAGGQAIAGGMFAGLVNAGVPVWTNTALVRLLTTDGAVTGAVLNQDGREVTVKTRQGVVLAAGGFDHNMEMRRQYQSESLTQDLSLGAEGNTGDIIGMTQELGAELANMDQTWWFPAVAPVKEGALPAILLAERSLPGSLIVDQSGRRFINESTDYMSFGQKLMALEKEGTPVTEMWLVFDQQYRNSYVFAGGSFPRMDLPQAWYDAGIAHKADNVAELARKTGLDAEALASTVGRFNLLAGAGNDEDFQRGASAYDRYYGDPTQAPNPNLRPLSGTVYAVKMVLSDLGTCGGVMTDRRGRVMTAKGEAIPGLYAQGNAAANIFGQTYPGAGATISQGLVYGYIIAKDAAERKAAARAA
ncbi:3-ketosteroid-delta-1-dehydrogenase [Propioniciclava coleopterorum]|uniref:3-oxosteroid 1-dehydrogenase n=1 Tax=Propioniciclava coleopterorum TaxID=2714937 RepID=A0A6G7Y563_9ACTN|nr:3-ketosteroid-delta-1-dehydrogenase [Propioniciclava coleopterorum]QIK71806.1 3-ketosteroid-delta-1-dehydrogenase [Propioniciclava coleopterorum]